MCVTNGSASVVDRPGPARPFLSVCELYFGHQFTRNRAQSFAGTPLSSPTPEGCQAAARSGLPPKLIPPGALKTSDTSEPPLWSSSRASVETPRDSPLQGLPSLATQLPGPITVSPPLSPASCHLPPFVVLHGFLISHLPWVLGGLPPITNSIKRP